jgi:mannose-6-phosphate isomerase-like protein (cupin superfamily)
MLIDSESVGAKRINLNHGTLKPGNNTGGGAHPCPYEEIYYILRGRGLLTIGHKTYEVCPDTVAYIPCAEYHRLDNTGDTDLAILTILPLPLDEGANPFYDARKRLWGTSFRKVADK